MIRLVSIERERLGRLAVPRFGAGLNEERGSFIVVAGGGGGDERGGSSFSTLFIGDQMGI